MIRTLIEVGDNAATFVVAVRAASIRQAVALAADRYPGSDTRVVFPLDPETFFVKEPTLETVSAELEVPAQSSP